jgi:hypothetical protein
MISPWILAERGTTMMDISTALAVRWLCSLAAYGPARTTDDRVIAINHAAEIAHCQAMCNGIMLYATRG